MNAHSETKHTDATPAVDFKLSCNGSHRESADNYHSIVVVLNDKYRVIVCRDEIQWILQKQNGQRHGQNRWDSLSYFRTRDGVIRSCRAYAGRLDAKTLSILESLPIILGGDE